jgi:hypothetical protein
VERYLERVLPAGRDLPRAVRVEQVGEMWLKPGGRPLGFTADEEFSVDRVAFSWRAQFPIVPLVSLHVLDCYAHGEGSLQLRAWRRVPLMRKGGADVAEGQALRYLAELPLVPQAMRANRELRWRELDARTVEVATSVQSKSVAVRLTFDDAGDVVAAFADARPHPESGTSVPRPWGGVFGSYETVGGIRIPTRAEARWELPSGPFTYWRCTIVSLHAA